MREYTGIYIKSDGNRNIRLIGNEIIDGHSTIINIVNIIKKIQDIIINIITYTSYLNLILKKFYTDLTE